MEFIMWIIGIIAASGGIVAFMRSAWFQRKLLVTKEAPAAAPMTLAQAHAQDHAYWMDEYSAILQKRCDHLYHHQNWYTCKMCGYEEPWVWEEGCQCRYEELRTLTDVHPVFTLIERQSYCRVHGRDFKLYPISDRKRGPYGPHANSEGAVERSRELTKGRSIRKIDYDIEGSH